MNYFQDPLGSIGSKCSQQERTCRNSLEMHEEPAGYVRVTIYDKHIHVLVIGTHSKACFMSICRCCMPGLDLRSEDNLYFAMILSALVYERLDDTVNSGNHLRTT